MKTFFYKVFLCIACTACVFKAYTQNNTIDSLTKVLQSQKQDSNRVNTLNAIAFEFRSNNPDTAIYFANEALVLAMKINYMAGAASAYLKMSTAKINLADYEEAQKNNALALNICNQLLGSEKVINKPEILRLKAAAYHNTALIYWYQGKYPEALKNNLVALDLRKQVNFKKGIADSYNNIGLIYWSQGNYPDALKNHYASLEIKKEIGDKKGIAASYTNIGNIYNDYGNYAEALKSHLAALKIDEELEDKKGIAASYNNIGKAYNDRGDYAEALKNYLVSLKIKREIGDKKGIANAYNNIGGVYNALGNYPEALKNHYASLKIKEEIGDKGGLTDSYTNIGSIYFSEKNYSEALKYFFSYLKAGEELEDSSSIADAYIQIGNTYTKQNKISEASLYLQKGLSLAKAIGSPAYIKNGYRALAGLDSLQGNFKQAFYDYKMYTLYRDSLFNEESTKKIVAAQMQYEFDKKDAIAKAEQDKKDTEAKRIKNQQYLVITALGTLVLAVIIIAVIQYRSKKHKQQANTQLQQQKEKVESTLNELKSTQAQLIQSEKMASLGELTAGIAHEIQNPLNFVNNFSEVSNELLDEMKTELATGNRQLATEIADDVKQNLEKILHHGKRADAIVKGMLQHSRVSTGQKEPTDINALADEYLRLSYHGMRAKDKTFNATIKTDFDESIDKINVVPQDIGRVLLNLFNNAFYAVNEKKKNLTGLNNYEPTVSVRTKKVDGKIEIHLKDNGTGIPQKVVDKIFQPFFTTKPTGQGTGLGLSLSYDIIKAHGGEIKVETNEGEGSEFVIQLPIN